MSSFPSFIHIDSEEKPPDAARKPYNSRTSRDFSHEGSRNCGLLWRSSALEMTEFAFVYSKL